MQTRLSRGAPDWCMTERMRTTKEKSRVLPWLLSLLLLALHCLPVTPQENTTETATDFTVTTSSFETNYSTDAIMTSLGRETTSVATESQTEMQTEIKTELQNSTTPQEELQTEWVTEVTTELENMRTSQEVNQTTESSENATQTIMPTIDALVNWTTESPENATEVFTSFENQTEIATELITVTEESNESTGSSSDDSDFMPVNVTTAPATNTTFGNTTAIIPLTTDLPNTSGQPTDLSPSFLIPFLIFMGLLFLLTILIFIIVLTKSRMKQSVSTYNLTPAANGDSTQIGYRNTAYQHGDVADDTDVECSMTEIRLEGKPTNGNTLHNIGEFEEELTPL